MTDPVVDTQFSSGTTITSPWLNGVNDFVNGQLQATPATRVVNSIATLRTLPKTSFTTVYVSSYYGDGLGGGGTFIQDSSDTTSTDNGGTVIVAADGARWKRQSSIYVSVKDFGARGNGTTDDTAAVQAAVTWASTNNRALYVPSGTYPISSPVTSTVAFTMIGEAQSPSVTTDYVQGVPVVTFQSSVAGDYCFKFGNTYQRGGQLRNFRVFGNNVAGSGIYLHNQGWDGLIDSITIEGFQQYGMTADYIQDMHIRALGIIECGAENTYPSLNLINGCNSVHFDRLHIEITPYMMNINNGADITFNGCHFEVSEYPSGAITAINRYSRYSQIIINNTSNHIDFNACLFAPNSVQAVAAHFSVPETSIGPFMTVSAGIKINIRGCQFRQTQTGKSSNMISFTNSSSCLVDGCSFDQVYIDQYSIVLSGTTFVNNDITWIDNGTSTNFYGIANSATGSPSIVQNNRLFCSNGSVAAKTVGNIFFSNSSSNYLSVGYNEIYINKYYKNHTAACRSISYLPPYRVDLTGKPTTLDLELYDFNTIFNFSGATTVSAITNIAIQQEITFVATGTGSATIVNSSGSVYLKGGVNAVIPVGATLSLKEVYNQFLFETGRSF